MLEHLMLLQENWDFSIKESWWVDTQKKQERFNKIYAMSPIVSLEAILITSCIDTAKERGISVVGIPGLFLTADIYDIVHMVLRGRLSELMSQLNPSIN